MERKRAGRDRWARASSDARDIRQQGQQPPQRTGPPPGQPPPVLGQPPPAQDRTLASASVVPSVPDSLLRMFVTGFSTMGELVVCTEALVAEADIKMVERVGQAGISFCH